MPNSAVCHPPTRITYHLARPIVVVAVVVVSVVALRVTPLFRIHALGADDTTRTAAQGQRERQARAKK